MCMLWPLSARYHRYVHVIAAICALLPLFVMTVICMLWPLSARYHRYVHVIAGICAFACYHRYLHVITVIFMLSARHHRYLRVICTLSPLSACYRRRSPWRTRTWRRSSGSSSRRWAAPPARCRCRESWRHTAWWSWRGTISTSWPWRPFSAGPSCARPRGSSGQSTKVSGRGV